MAAQLNFIIALIAIIIVLMLYFFGIKGPLLGNYDHEYTVKFTCGVSHATFTPALMPVNPGIYSTAINIYSPHDENAFTKQAVLSPREPQFGSSSAPVNMSLNAGQATNADCYDIRTILGQDPFLEDSFIEGFLRINSPEPLTVVPVYTLQGTNAYGSPLGEPNIDVEYNVPERLYQSR